MALITLAVTLARLGGELMGGSDSLFSREAGGKAALVGIVWLIREAAAGLPADGPVGAVLLDRRGGPALDLESPLAP